MIRATRPERHEAARCVICSEPYPEVTLADGSYAHKCCRDRYYGCRDVFPPSRISHRKPQPENGPF